MAGDLGSHRFIALFIPPLDKRDNLCYALVVGNPVQWRYPVNKRDSDVKKAKKRRSSRYPGRPLSEALDMVGELDGFGGNTDTRILAPALNMSDKASGFLRLLAAARYFGLIQREKSTVSLTPLGRRLAVPVSAEEKESAIHEAFLNSEPFAQTARQFGGKALPREEVFKNFLRRTFDLTPHGADVFIQVFIASAQTAGMLQEREGEMVVVGPEELAPMAELPTVERPLAAPLTEGITEHVPSAQAVAADLERIRLEAKRDLIAKIPDFDSNWTGDNIRLVRDMIFDLMDRLEKKESTTRPHDPSTS
jgi:hypothetical protein